MKNFLCTKDFSAGADDFDIIQDLRDEKAVLVGRLRIAEAALANLKTEKAPFYTRPSYRKGVAWVAENDEPDWLNLAQVSEQISVQVLAEVGSKTVMQVALDITQYRTKTGEHK